MSVLQSAARMLPGETINELAAQWREARRQATERVIGPTPAGAAEDERLALAAETDEAELHRRLFEGGVRVGAAAQRSLGRTLQAPELPHLLGALGVPCLEGGTWTTVPGQPGLRFARRPCCSGPGHASRCDAWREAIDGLVLGLTGHLRYAALTRRDAECTSTVAEADDATRSPG